MNILKIILNLKNNYEKKFIFPLQNLTLSGYDIFKILCNIPIKLKKIKYLNEKTHISILYENSVEYVILSFFVILNNHILVPINPQLSKNEIFEIYKKSNSKFLITSKNKKDKVKRIKNIIYFDFSIDLLKEKNLNTKFFTKKKKNTGVILLLYTSGSTGEPKGSLLNEKNIFSNANVIANHHKINKKTNTLVLMPMFHNNGFIISFLSTVLKSGTVIIAPANFIILKFWEIIQRYKITYTSLMPSVLSMILEYTKKDIKNNSLRIIACGGQKLSHSTQVKFENKFNLKIIEHYGLTETTSISTVMPLKKRILSSVGKVIKGTKIKIFDENKKTLKSFGFGEVCISGQNVFKGYYNNKKLNKIKFFKGFLKTGDFARLNKKKYLYFKSRKDFMIIKGGENIYPAEVENVINKHSKVIESAVVGHKDNFYGQDIYAFIKLLKYKKIYKKEIEKNLIKKLAKFKIPKKIFFLGKNISMNEIPKTPTNKIHYRVLQKVLANEK